MSIHAITFRIHEDSSYQTRWNSVNEAIKKETSSTYWAEPTSFFLIESSKNSQQLASAIDANSSFANDRDLLLVTNLSEKGYTAIGKVKDGDLHVLMKKR
ncbi:hypothetical protein [Hyphomicrobium sp.]|uniref:hypothetical protein n=1 Tax=Hyphomicrobium sp. TaxID=82 RepID=UPI001D6F0979|nr:hypothetical protein [Hyphomicrobium sp.]MBY0560703.1 hypothetical protein [Hyphomicrobium sp.]